MALQVLGRKRGSRRPRAIETRGKTRRILVDPDGQTVRADALADRLPIRQICAEVGDGGSGVEDVIGLILGAELYPPTFGDEPERVAYEELSRFIGQGRVANPAC